MPPPLVDVRPPGRSRLKRALFQVTHQLVQVLVEMLRKHLDAHPVDAGFALVALDRAKGFADHRGVDPTRRRSAGSVAVTSGTIDITRCQSQR